MNEFRLMIFCDAPSHRPLTVDAIRYIGDQVGGGNTVLIQDSPVSQKAIFGGSMGGPEDPSLARRYIDEGRSRHEFTCRKCGLRAEFRIETAQRLMQTLVDDETWPWTKRSREGGLSESVSRMSLTDLAARVSK